jgi:hypothetical protein
VISNVRPESRASLSFAFGASPLPNRRLTPGAVQDSQANVCTAEHEEVIKPVSVELRRKVLEEYEMSTVNPDDYEIDYLVGPDLGGQEDIRNLWPEPKNSAVWNSEAKDDLEERLHGLVCSGQLGIQTAQHDISSNWIEAYQKYFKTDQPPSALSITIASLARHAVLAVSFRDPNRLKP